MSRRVCIGIVGGLLALGAAGTAAQARGARPRIAVLGITVEQQRAEVRDKLTAAVAGGLVASGADVVDSATAARSVAAKGLAGCDTSTCRIAIAEATGARLLLRGRVETVGRSYTVHLEMIDGDTGTLIGVHEDRCEICTENEAYEAASMAASELKVEVMKRLDAGAAGRPADADDSSTKNATTKNAAKSPTPATEYRALSDSQRDPAGLSGTTLTGSGAEGGGDAKPPRWRAWSVAGMAAGAVAIGTGILMVSIDQTGTCSHDPGVECRDNFKTRAGGYTAIGGGLLAVALGATLLIGRF